MANEQAKENIYTLMEIDMKALSSRIKNMELEDSVPKRKDSTMVCVFDMQDNGKTESNMEKGPTLMLIRMSTLDGGSSAKNMEMELTSTTTQEPN